MAERRTRRVAVENGGLWRVRRRLQREVLRDVMLSASECDTWLTLEELARITRYPEASISAQLRHLRKPRHGGYLLRKRCRMRARTPMSRIEMELAVGPIWEYRLERWRRTVGAVTDRVRALTGCAARSGKRRG